MEKWSKRLLVCAVVMAVAVVLVTLVNGTMYVGADGVPIHSRRCSVCGRRLSHNSVILSPKGDPHCSPCFVSHVLDARSD